MTQEERDSILVEDIILYLESLITDKAFVARSKQTREEARALTPRKQERALIPLYISLEEVLVRNVPKDQQATAREKIRHDVATRFPIAGLHVEFLLLFLKAGKQTLYLYSAMLRTIIRSLSLVLDDGGIEEILASIDEGHDILAVRSYDNDLDYEALYERLEVRKGASLEELDSITFFRSLYAYIKKEVTSRVGADVALETFYETFEFVSTHYDDTLLNRYLAVIPEEILESGRFLLARRRQLDTKVAGQAQEIDDVTRRLVRRNEELEKAREQLQRRLTQLDETTEKLKENDSQLNQSTRMIELLLESIDEGIVTTDRSGRVTSINTSALVMLGRKQEEVLGLPWTEVVAVEDVEGTVVPPERAPLFAVLEHHVSMTDSEYLYRRPDGTAFPVIVTISPLFDETIIGTVIAFRDFTKEKEIERSKSTFVSVAAHTMRTPVTAIRLNTELLLSPKAGVTDADLRRRLEDIQTSNNRLLSVVSTLLTVSEIELGTIATRPQKSDIPSIADIILHRFDTTVQEKRLQVVKRYQHDLPQFLVDQRLLYTLFEHLISNAVTYTRPDDTISIAIGSREESLIIDVADTGHGIPVEDQSKIFTKLFRARNAEGIYPDGIGMGLYIVKLIAERYGGDISVSSQEGKGTIVHIAIPLAQITT